MPALRFGAGVETWRLGVARRCLRTAGVRPVVPAGRLSIDEDVAVDGTEPVENRTRFEVRCLLREPKEGSYAVGLTGEIDSAARRLGRRSARGTAAVVYMTLGVRV